MHHLESIEGLYRLSTIPPCLLAVAAHPPSAPSSLTLHMYLGEFA